MPYIYSTTQYSIGNKMHTGARPPGTAHSVGNPGSVRPIIAIPVATIPTCMNVGTNLTSFASK